MSQKWEELFGSEWPWVQKLGSAIRDPEEKKVFWETIKAKKLADSSYSVYSDFPSTGNAKERAMVECCNFVRGLRRGEDVVKKRGE